jgi:hypothetical protein
LSRHAAARLLRNCSVLRLARGRRQTMPVKPGSRLLTLAAAANSTTAEPTAVDAGIIAHGRDIIATGMEGLRQLAAMLDEGFGPRLQGPEMLTGVNLGDWPI